MTPLEMATTDELIEELFSRFEDGVILMRREHEVDKTGVFLRRFKGDDYMLIGMMQHACSICSDNIVEDEQPYQGE